MGCSHAKIFSSLKPSSEKVISITFDDGPSLKTTPHVLAVLKKYKILATFFVLGERAKRFPHLLKKIVQEGHTLANHSYDHRCFTKLSKDQQDQDIKKTTQILSAYQHDITYFRPPYGAKNKNTQDIAQKNHLDIVLWSIDPEDWRRPSKKKLIASVLSNLHPGGILLLHDIHQGTAAALEELIVCIQKKGYRFVPLTYHPS